MDPAHVRWVVTLRSALARSPDSAEQDTAFDVVADFLREHVLQQGASCWQFGSTLLNVLPTAQMVIRGSTQRSV